MWSRGRWRASREPALAPTPANRRSPVRVLATTLPLDIDECGAVAYAPPRRRLTTGSHAEFVGALVHEFNTSLASLKGASDLLARRRHELDAAVLGDLSAVIERQSGRVAWLVRLLEAVDGDGSSR